ncbi:hypothetical protein EVAR_80908_1 [Eumeta japonica]|uniref:Uncharacterized protein n=1 Tax=Eumeta variegata TaxID=151549 RepID=A0A4C1V084_EUMVA|nr:hypothetical protein EVAR_80908_1 [Eumeta japonica]
MDHCFDVGNDSTLTRCTAHMARTAPGDDKNLSKPTTAGPALKSRVFVNTSPVYTGGFPKSAPSSETVVRSYGTAAGAVGTSAFTQMRGARDEAAPALYSTENGRCACSQYWYYYNANDTIISVEPYGSQWECDNVGTAHTGRVRDGPRVTPELWSADSAKYSARASAGRATAPRGRRMQKRALSDSVSSATDFPRDDLKLVTE